MDSLEQWTDFRKGEIVKGPRKRKIRCQMCEKRDSNPVHDGKATWNDTGRPVYICDECQDAQDIDAAQEQDQDD